MLERHVQPSAGGDTGFGEVEAESLVRSLRQTYNSGRTRGLQWRKRQLHALDAMLKERQSVFEDALEADLGKPVFESYIGELGFLGGEVHHAIKHLAEWAAPRKVSTPLVNQPGKSYVQPEPLGVALIIAPWNYPVQLVLGPLVAAIAAGNCAVLKPSELTPHCSAAIAEWVPKYLDDDCYAVVEGGVPETQALLAQRFDHIFYTGNGRVGRVVMEAAAKHLTPVTLELGGKSPAIVDREVDLDVTAKRIVWGKFFNAGQTCVAPDYVLVDQSLEQALLDRLRQTVSEFYGADPRRSDSYARIVNERHFERLRRLLDEGEIVTGGEAVAEDRYIAPTIIRDVPKDGQLMADEIFGPILPVLAVPDVDAAIDEVNARPKPLALYVFTKNKRVARRVLEQTSSGGACVNDTVAHLSVPELPFGGVGASGMGAYHGQVGFETFSHLKSVLDKGYRPDPPLRYPPYDEKKLKWVKRLT